MTDTTLSTPATKSGYANATHGLKMYYEIRGSGDPLVVLPGAFMSIDQMGEFIPRMAETRQVIAFEMQAHMRTADIDRPLSYEGMADDVATALTALGIAQADVFGFSLGAGVAVQLAVRHPERVHKLIAASVSYNTAGLYPEAASGVELTPEMFAGTPWEAEYARLAPTTPEGWPKLLSRVSRLDSQPQDWPQDSIRGIKAPTLLILGDADIIKPEHIVDMFRLVGGGVMGDMVGLPNARLAILPGTTHLGMMTRVDWLVSMVGEFLAAPVK